MTQSTQRFYKVIDVACEAKDAYSFNDANKSRIGHLLKLSIPSCGKELVADTRVCNPEDSECKVNIVGVFDYIKWDGSAHDPIEISCRLSPQNTALLQEGLASLMQQRADLMQRADIEAAWIIYDYDYHEGKYFKCFYTDKKPIKFVITDGTVAWTAQYVDRSIQQPVNVNFQLSLSPDKEAGEQQLFYAFRTNGTTFNQKIGG